MYLVPPTKQNYTEVNLEELEHLFYSHEGVELLNNVLTTMEMKNVHLLYCGLTWLAYFLDACEQASNITVLFLDNTSPAESVLTK